MDSEGFISLVAAHTAAGRNCKSDPPPTPASGRGFGRFAMQSSEVASRKVVEDKVLLLYSREDDLQAIEKVNKYTSNQILLLPLGEVVSTTASPYFLALLYINI